MEDTGEVEMKNPEDPGLSEAKDRALKYWDSARQYRRKTMKEAWHCGRALCEVRGKLPHGEWREWLESVGIPKSTAYLWMRFSKNCELSKIGQFNSMNQALKALQPAPKEPARKVEPDVETKGEASSVEKEDVTEGDGTQRLPVEGESAQEIQKLRNQLHDTKIQLSEAKEQLHQTEEKKRQTEEENTRLREERDRFKLLLEEHGISW